MEWRFKWSEHHIKRVNRQWRQIIHAAVKGAGQGNGNLYSRVGVVALTNVKQTWDAADIAKLLVKEAELAACQSEDHAV